ncbi:hypothetical protein KSP40_PGU014441 [Platanthera guangdongensis]|uniref:MaoC-like domain-containing protein n=1 Tax=Platanthera guangdongensis TaxID=2320717 RepID=A0ABR2M495_9ASPA
MMCHKIAQLASVQLLRQADRDVSKPSDPNPSSPPVAVAVSAPFSSSPPEARNPLKVGSTLREVRRFSASDVAAYSAVSGDQNPLHSDPEFARRIAGFERGSIVHGMLVATLFPTVIASHFVSGYPHALILSHFRIYAASLVPLLEMLLKCDYCVNEDYMDGARQEVWRDSRGEAPERVTENAPVLKA